MTQGTPSGDSCEILQAREILVVWHSQTGAARQLAQALAAAADAAGEGRVQSRLVHAGEADLAAVLNASAYVFVSPEYLAGMAGAVKDFFDRCYYGALERIAGRPYAIVIAAGSDGANAARQIARIATGWRLRAVADPLIVCTHAQTTEAIVAPKHLLESELAGARELGAALAAGLALGVF